MKDQDTFDANLFPVPIEQARAFVGEYIHKIPSVNRLARRMGYSRSYFVYVLRNITKRLLLNYYGKSDTSGSKPQ